MSDEPIPLATTSLADTIWPEDVFLHAPLHMSEEAFEHFTDGEFSGKAEWVDGEVVIPMATSVRHAKIVAFLLQLLGYFVIQRGLGEVLGPEVQLRFSKLRRRRVPDVMFISALHADIYRANHIEGAPDLAVEVVSPDSVKRDWRDKYLEYEKAGVKEYWVIDPISNNLEAYHLDDTGQYQQIMLSEEGRISSRLLPGFFLKPEWFLAEQLPNPFVLAEAMS